MPAFAGMTWMREAPVRSGDHVLILVPLARIVMFAVANRAPVVPGFDPFGAQLPMFAVAPLFPALLAALIAGVVGGAAARSPEQVAACARACRPIKAARAKSRHRGAGSAGERGRAGAELDRRDRVSSSVGGMIHENCDAEDLDRILTYPTWSRRCARHSAPR
jgi:hypothetical protein